MAAQAATQDTPAYAGVGNDLALWAAAGVVSVTASSLWPQLSLCPGCWWDLYLALSSSAGPFALFLLDSSCSCLIPPFLASFRNPLLSHQVAFLLRDLRIPFPILEVQFPGGSFLPMVLARLCVCH